MSRTHFPIAIVGGGLAGWALAEALVRSGCPPQDISLLEARRPGSGASGVPWGLMHPFPGRSLYPRPGYLDAWRSSLAWLDRLQAGAETEIRRRLPLWRLSDDPATISRFAKSYARGRAEIPDYPLSEPNREQLALLSGKPANAFAAYSLPEAALGNFGALIGQLRRQCEGLQTRLLTERLSIRPGMAGWEVAGPDLRLTASQLILAPGTGLQAIFPALPLVASRGEVALFALPAQPELPMALSAAGHYVASLGQGRYLTGATHYDGARPWPPEQSWRGLQAGLPWLPMAEARLLRIWSGVRCGLARDREPLLGPVPASPGLWTMSGFSTRGLLLIPSAAEALAQELLTGQPTVPDWMRPERLEQAVWQIEG